MNKQNNSRGQGETVNRELSDNRLVYSRMMMKQKDGSEYIIIRYMDSGFFVSGDGSFREPWQEIAYRRIKAYNYDVNEHWGEKMG